MNCLDVNILRLVYKYITGAAKIITHFPEKTLCALDNFTLVIILRFNNFEKDNKFLICPGLAEKNRN